MELKFQFLAISSGGHLEVRTIYLNLCNSIDMQCTHAISNEFNNI